MARRTELIAALGATALGICWLAEMAQIFHYMFLTGMIFGAGGGSRSGVSEFPLLLTCAIGAGVMCALSLAAYAHAVRQVHAALPLLWALTVLIIVGIGGMLFAPGLFWPLQAQIVLPEIMAGWMTPLVVAVGMMTGISALSAASVELPVQETRSNTSARAGESI